jgi:adenosylcobinamide-GDP ribazoletransferase
LSKSGHLPVTGWEKAAMASPAWDEWAPWLARRAGELSAAVVFLTQLPLPRHAPEDGAVARGAWAFPLAGFVVGLIGAVVYAIAHALVLFPWPAAALTIAATLLVTGCLHEDGLADTADGFGGGDTRERKLDIMRDSRIGAYGVCALLISLLIRADAIASLTETALVAAALIAAHSGGRAAMAAVMLFLPPARSDGLSFTAGQPSAARAALAAGIGFLIVLFCVGPAHAIVAVIVVAIAVALLAWTSMRQIGGQTGDVLGAVEQVSEIAILLVALR